MTTSTMESTSATTLKGYAQLAIENTYENPNNKDVGYIYNNGAQNKELEINYNWILEQLKLSK